jgi:hypothetical protein
MGAHIDKTGRFQSDKYPSCPAGKVPLSIEDATAQDLLWEYAQRRREVDAEFAADLELCLRAAGYKPAPAMPEYSGQTEGVVIAFNIDSCWGAVQYPHRTGHRVVSFHSTTYHGRNFPYVGERVYIVFADRDGGDLLALYEVTS